jgi:hypothetical protein
MTMVENNMAREDLNRAVAAGVIDQGTAARLAAFWALPAESASFDSEDEHLRLVTGFGDIFVAIGLVLFLGALVFLTHDKSWFVPSFAVMVAAWILAELFTRIRRQALPSILLLLAFAGAVFMGVISLLPGDVEAEGIAVAGLATGGAVALHWLRFRVPVTVAAACAAATAVIVGIIGAFIPNIVGVFNGLIFLPMGLAIFAFAMYFDTSDLARRTRRTDIAFWLHALAAPMVVHPVMQNIMKGDTPGVMEAALTVLVFLCLSLVALIVDRRAMLVSSLIYLNYAIYSMLEAGDALPSTSMVVLLVGAIVLAMSFAWRPLRAFLLKLLPAAISGRVPSAHLTSLKAS